jgi:hypothetical protein
MAKLDAEKLAKKGQRNSSVTIDPAAKPAQPPKKGQPAPEPPKKPLQLTGERRNIRIL